MNTLALRTFAAVVALGLLAAPRLEAACPNAAALLVLEPGTGSLSIPLPAPPPGTLRTVERVLHGTASLSPTTLTFVPAESFWSVGSSVVVLRNTLGTGITFQQYWVLAGGRRTEASLLPFDLAGLGPHWSQSGSTSEAQELGSAAFRGTTGLRLLAGATSNPFVEGKPVNWDPGIGDTRSARSGRTALQGPPPTTSIDPDGFALAIPGDGLTVISSGLPSEPLFEVQLRQLGSALEARLRDPIGGVSEPWKALSSSAHQLELLNWFDSVGVPAGALLFVDGAVFQSLNVGQMIADPETPPLMRFGRMGTAGSVSNFDLDDLSVAWSNGQRFVCMAATDFETAAFESPFTTFQGENLLIESSARDSLSYQLRASLQGSATGGQLQFAVPATPVAQRVGLRLRFDLDVTSLGAGDGPINLVEALTPSSGPRAFRVQVVQTVAGLVLRVLARSGSLAITSVGSIPMDFGPHTLELDWQRSTTDLRPTGYVRVWVDGNDAGRIEIPNLDNAQVPLSSIRIGAVNATSTAPEGSVLIDDIQLWREQ